MKARSQILQSDSRGRIVLPQDVRGFGLYELAADPETPGHYHLYPLQTKRIADLRNRKKVQVPDWKERYRFLEHEVFPKMKATAEAWNEMTSNRSSSVIEAIVLFGSYARKDAFQNSDLDLALFVSPFPSFSKRNEIQKFFESELRLEIRSLKSLGAECELSLIFVSPTMPAKISPLGFSIAEEGIVIHSRANFFDDWKGAVRALMRHHKVESMGEGRSRLWKWNNDEGQ